MTSSAQSKKRERKRTLCSFYASDEKKLFTHSRVRDKIEGLAVTFCAGTARRGKDAPAVFQSLSCAADTKRKRNGPKSVASGAAFSVSASGQQQ